MNIQERAVMEQALDALDWNKCYLPNGHPSTLSNGAIAALRQALAEPARTFVDPVTDGMVQQKQEFEDRIITIILLWADSQETDNPQEVGVMRAHIRQVLAADESVKPALPISGPVTWEEAETALANAVACGRTIGLKDMHRALEGFAAGRAVGVEL